MKQIQFIFGIHNHQPVGNFDSVFEEACNRSYLPFLEELERHPSLSMVIHFSGSLMEWLDTHRPEVLNLLAHLVQRGNIEILGSGFYEPILAMIPRRDRIGQLEMMTNYIHDRVGYDLQGGWLTERVWEPHLAMSLVDGGIRYVVVDDYHFLSAGLKTEQLTGYFHTEQEGRVLGVFPISQTLRYAMPFQDPQVTVDHLRSFATEQGERVLVMADDGEKFGIWPGTHQTVYEEGWLNRFFTLLEENADWLHTTTFCDYAASQPSQGLIYLPTASYFEMSQWTLPTDRGRDLDQLVHDLEEMNRAETSRPFIKGGMWRNFLSKYEESNWMQKRVQDLSRRIADYEAVEGQQVPASLRQDLYRAQCNCAFWHGVFGGLYLPHLRHAIFQHIIKAENAFEKLNGHPRQPLDLDFDGNLEAVLRSDRLQLIVSQMDGQIRELDWLPADFNVTNYIQRYAEHYHEKLSQAHPAGSGNGSIHDLVLAKEAGLQERLFVDQYRRHGAKDMILDPEETLDRFYKGLIQNRLQFPEDRFQLEQEEQHVFLTGMGFASGIPVEVQKSYSLEGSRLTLEIRLTNRGTERLEGRYGIEFHFGLLGGDAPDRYYELSGQDRKPLNTMSAERDLSRLALVDEWDDFRIDLQLSRPALLWRAPLETISMSEAGFERVYQASSLLPTWPITVSPGAVEAFKLTLQFDSIHN